MPTFSFKKHGITSETVKKMILGAGVIYKNLVYTPGEGGAAGSWSGTVLGATSGGITFHYEIQWLEVEVDGATVLVKGVSRQKIGESAYLEGNMTEITADILVTALHMEAATGSDASGDSNYTKYVTKQNISSGDYLTNIAYVGTLSDGKKVIIILPNAICLEAFEINPQNANQTTFAVKFECTADLSNDELDKLDVQIYYPVSEA